jgi:hypothetical protein
VDSILETRVPSDGIGTVIDIPPVRFGSKRPASSMSIPSFEVVSGTLRIGQVPMGHRAHYWIVFEEIGTPIHQLKAFYKIFLALRDAVLGMCVRVRRSIV